MKRNKTAVLLLLIMTILFGCSKADSAYTIRDYGDFLIALPDDWKVLTDMNSNFIASGFFFYSAELTDKQETTRYAYLSLEYEAGEYISLDEIDDTYGYYWAERITNKGFIQAEFLNSAHKAFGDTQGAIVIMSLDYGDRDSVCYFVILPHEEKTYFFIFEVYDKSYLGVVKHIIDSITFYADV